jgi:hypothetical protein
MLDAGKQLRLLGFDVQAGFVRVAFGDVDDFIEGEDFQPGVGGRARSG